MNEELQEFLSLSLKDSYRGGVVIRIEGGNYDEKYRKVVVTSLDGSKGERAFIFNVHHERIVEI